MTVEKAREVADLAYSISSLTSDLAFLESCEKSGNYSMIQSFAAKHFDEDTISKMNQSFCGIAKTIINNQLSEATKKLEAL
jgi:hypothetical protein